MSYDPQKDWRTHMGRYEGRVAHEALSDQVTFWRVVFRILAFPVWFPFYLRRVEKRRREMMGFAVEQARNRLITDELVKEISLAWVKAHADRYPLAEYDPRLPGLQRTFRSMLKRQKI
jgi:hypothetical protein